MKYKTFDESIQEVIDTINLAIAIAKKRKIITEINFMILIHFLNFDVHFFVESLGELKNET